MKALFVAYQDEVTRHWAPVGKLTKQGDQYRFVYTKGVRDFADFLPFGRMTDLKSAYYSKELFPLFSNRILPKSRPEHTEYLHWLGMSEGEHNALEELSRTGGLRATDSLELIPLPAPSANGNYDEFFFCRGIGHAHQGLKSRVDALREGEQLYLLRDVQNPSDTDALALRADDPFAMVGFAPAYLAKDFSALLDGAKAPNVRVTVAQVNHSAPSQYRLLCRLQAPWPTQFSPCSATEYQELNDDHLLEG